MRTTALTPGKRRLPFSFLGHVALYSLNPHLTYGDQSAGASDSPELNSAASLQHGTLSRPAADGDDEDEARAEADAHVDGDMDSFAFEGDGDDMDNFKGDMHDEIDGLGTNVRADLMEDDFDGDERGHGDQGDEDRNDDGLECHDKLELDYENGDDNENKNDDGLETASTETPLDADFSWDSVSKRVLDDCHRLSRASNWDTFRGQKLLGSAARSRSRSNGSISRPRLQLGAVSEIPLDVDLDASSRGSEGACVGLRDGVECRSFESLAKHFSKLGDSAFRGSNFLLPSNGGEGPGLQGNRAPLRNLLMTSAWAEILGLAPTRPLEGLGGRKGAVGPLKVKGLGLPQRQLSMEEAAEYGLRLERQLKRIVKASLLAMDQILRREVLLDKSVPPDKPHVVLSKAIDGGTDKKGSAKGSAKEKGDDEENDEFGMKAKQKESVEGEWAGPLSVADLQSVYSRPPTTARDFESLPILLQQQLALCGTTNPDPAKTLVWARFSHELFKLFKQTIHVGAWRSQLRAEFPRMCRFATRWLKKLGVSCGPCGMRLGSPVAPPQFQADAGGPILSVFLRDFAAALRAKYPVDGDSGGRPFDHRREKERWRADDEVAEGTGGEVDDDEDEDEEEDEEEGKDLRKGSFLGSEVETKGRDRYTAERGGISDEEDGNDDKNDVTEERKEKKRFEDISGEDTAVNLYARHFITDAVLAYAHEALNRGDCLDALLLRGADVSLGPDGRVRRPPSWMTENARRFAKSPKARHQSFAPFQPRYKPAFLNFLFKFGGHGALLSAFAELYQTQIYLCSTDLAGRRLWTRFTPRVCVASDDHPGELEAPGGRSGGTLPGGARGTGGGLASVGGDSRSYEEEKTRLQRKEAAFPCAFLRASRHGLTHLLPDSPLLHTVDASDISTTQSHSAEPHTKQSHTHSHSGGSPVAVRKVQSPLALARLVDPFDPDLTALRHDREAASKQEREPPTIMMYTPKPIKPVSQNREAKSSSGRLRDRTQLSVIYP